MSIKSLFENIADAIKDKNPNVTNVTPVEMPSAIRDIPTGSSTAVGVTYDNTASGLTANNVQGAIDELAGNVSAITSDLSELNSNKADFIQAFSSATDTTYQDSGSNAYTVPETGWYRIMVRNNAYIQISGQTILFANANEMGQMMLPLKSGAILNCYGNATGAYILITKFEN